MAEIGKNIIENLTTAMYENSYTVYREYIQNSADSIDKAIDSGIITASEATIDIEIEYTKRKITINDNAMGIPKDEFYKKLSDIADSQKDKTKEKGFRGIGRLAGLAYCNTLIFRTSFKGENVESVMKWDGVKLREVLSDVNQHPSASNLVDSIIECEVIPCDKNSHFFEVIMEGVIPESDNLLDEHEVKEYLQMVAPVPYLNSFIFRSKIEEFIKKENLKIDQYNVLINGNPIFKPYKTILYEGTEDKKTQYDEINDIEFRKFETKDGELLGWLWFGVTKFEKQIPIINPTRGIRIRKENIQIGNEDTLSYPKFYKESRGNCYFVGELFAVSPNLIPNARRDYFNTNPTLKKFEELITPTLYKEFYDLYHYASKVRSSFKKAAGYEKKQQEFQEKVDNAGFLDSEDMLEAKKELESDKTNLEKAQREIELRQKDAEKSSVLNRVFKQIETTYKPLEKKDEKTEKTPKKEEKDTKKYLTQNLSKYGKKEQKLISKIYGIVKAILPKDMAEMVITKIQEELSK